MINSYTSTSQTLLANSAINFVTDKVKTGCGVTHIEGTTSFLLNKPGIYEVEFNGSAAVSGAIAGNIIVQLQENGVNSAGASSTATSASTTTLVPLSFSTLVRVRPSCSSINNSITLTFINSGVDAIYNNVNVIITRIC